MKETLMTPKLSLHLLVSYQSIARCPPMLALKYAELPFRRLHVNNALPMASQTALYVKDSRRRKIVRVCCW